MRWPAAWQTAALELLKNTSIDCLLSAAGRSPGPLEAEARAQGLAVLSEPPVGVRVIQGEWPGVQVGARGGGTASAGPTGVPWLDSNGWRIRLEAALHPEAAIWVEAPPKGSVLAADGYARAFSDSAAFCGGWIISLDDAFAAGIVAGNRRALDGWQALADATRFFHRHSEWAGYAPNAALGVVSDFTGDNEFLAGETLNLLSRANQQYRVIVKNAVAEKAWAGLRAVLYPDAQPPSTVLRKQIEAAVYAGTTLIAGPKWGAAPGAPANTQPRPRYDVRRYGQGRVAIAKSEPDDPYVLANDAVLLMSRRFELVRIFNAGAVGVYFTAAPGGKRALLHMISYANRGPEDASVWIAGRYRSARLWTPGREEARPLEVHSNGAGVELHLPPVAQYAAAELDS